MHHVKGLKLTSKIWRDLELKDKIGLGALEAYKSNPTCKFEGC